MTLFEPYPVSAGAIRETAEQSTAGIEALRQLRADVDVEHRSALSAVEGDLLPYIESAPDAAGNHSQAVIARLSFARGATHLFAIAVDNFNTDSSDPRSVSKLNAAYETAAADHFGVDASEYTKDESGVQMLDKSRYTGAVTNAKEALVADLTAEYGRLDKKLDEDAAEIAAMLKGADPRANDVRAMFEAGALPSYAALLFPDVNLHGAKLARLPTDLRGMSDEQLAEYLVKEPGTYAVLGNQLERLVPGIVGLVGREIAEQLRNAELDGKGSGEEIRRLRTQLKAWQDISLDVTASIYANLGAEGSLELLTKLNRLTEATGEDPLSLAKVLRRGLVLADNVWSDEQSARFGSDLGEELARDLESRDAVAYLLHDQAYSTALLDPLADKIAELDSSSTALNTLIPHGALDGPVNVTEALFSALAKNGEAALDFFSPGSGDSGELAKRHEWFLQDRTFQTPDGLGDLMTALEAATLDETNVGDPERAKLAAGLVSSIAEYIPDRDLDDDFVSDKAKVSLAHILSGYMDSVSEALLNPEAAGERGSGQSFHPEADGTSRALFETTELKSLVKLAVSSDAGFSSMRYGVSAYEHLALQREISTHGELTAAALNNDARIEGFFTDCVGEYQAGENAENDERRAAWIDMGSSLVGLIPLPGSDEVGEFGAKTIGFLVDQATNASTDRLTEAYANSVGVADGAPAAEKALEERQVAIATAMYEPDGAHPDLISHAELRTAASGFTDDEFERWFGSSQNPKLPSAEEIRTMSQDERDQYENVLKAALVNSSPSFEEGTYQSMYKSTFIEFQNR